MEEDTMREDDGIHSFDVGSIKLTMIADGVIPLPAEIFPTLDEDVFRSTLSRVGVSSDTFPAAVNAFVIEIDETVHLVDAGAGSTIAPTLGKVSERLGTAGYAPEQIQSLIVSHLHPDHIGGAVSEGRAVFPNAEMIVSETEHAFWTDPDNRANAPEDSQPFFDMATGAINAYEDRLRLLSGEADVITGITALPLPGHTPGHCGFAISSGRDNLLIWADIVHMQHLQFNDPEVYLAFDVDPEQAVATRKKVLDQVAVDNLAIAGMHLLYPGTGQVEKKTSGGYQFIQD